MTITATTAKGQTFNVGDRVTIGSSKVVRVICQITEDGEVCCHRLEHGQAPSAWSHIDRLVIVEAAPVAEPTGIDRWAAPAVYADS